MPSFNKSVALTALSVVSMFFAVCADTNVFAAEMLTAERPKDEAFRRELKKEMSSLNITVEATEADIANNLNRVVPKELYKGSTETRGLTATVLRNGPIIVSAADNYLYLTIPITMSMSYGMFETPAINNRLKFRLNARVTPDWKIAADVFYLGLSDLFADNIGIGPVKIKPRTVIDTITQPVQRILSDLINRKLNEQFPLKAQVTKVWNSAQKPIMIEKKYNAWLNISPQEIQMYPFYAQSGLMKLSVGLKSFAELVVGPEPPAAVPVPLPSLKQATGADKAFRITLNTELFYKDLRDIALPLLLNKELGSDGKSIVLKDLDIYGNGDRIVIKVDATGTLEGLFYLTCRPVFNPQTNVFSVEDVDFDMQTKSLLLQSAGWFLQGTIRSKIKEKLNMDLTQRLTQVHEMAGKAMERMKLAENVYLTGSLKTMKLSDVMGQKDKLSIQVNAEGETSIIFR